MFAFSNRWLSSTVVLGFGLGSMALAAEKSSEPQPPLITPSKATTNVTGPLDADGYVDFVAALNEQLGAGVSPNENAAIPLLQAMGPCEGNSVVTNLVLKELGQRPWQPGDLDFQSMGELGRARFGDNQAAAQAFYNQQGQAGSRPWTEKDFPDMAAVLSTNAQSLTAISEGLKRPKYYRPLVRRDSNDTMIMLLLPDIQESRDVARQLQMRAMLHLGHGRLAESRQDLMSLHCLARHIARGGTLIEGLVGIAIDAMAMHSDSVWLHHPAQTAETIAEYRAELQALPAVGDVARQMNLTERYCGLDATQAIARGRHGSVMSLSAYDAGELGVDNFDRWMSPEGFADALVAMSVNWDVAMSTMNGLYDDLSKVAAASTRQERLAVLGELDKRLLQIRSDATSVKGVVSSVFGGNKARGKNLANVLASLLIPAVGSACEAYDRAATRREVLDVLFAVAELEKTEGMPPESLAVLVPKYLKSVPIDRYSLEPMRYLTDGTAVKVYGVGPNGVDNHGLTYGQGEGNDDLVYSLPPTP
ncbi:hypothetical protein GC163_15970 [bacterium]|nr:hypothetical protein [bacterium]